MVLCKASSVYEEYNGFGNHYVDNTPHGKVVYSLKNICIQS